MTKSEKMKRLVELEIKLSKMKKVYEERDELIEWLGENNFNEYSHKGFTVIIDETFSEKNKVWKPCAFTKYTSKLIKNK